MLDNASAAWATSAPARRKYLERPCPCQTSMLASTSLRRCALAVCAVTPASRASFFALRERPSISASTMAARLGSASMAAAVAMRRGCMVQLSRCRRVRVHAEHFGRRRTVWGRLRPSRGRRPMERRQVLKLAAAAAAGLGFPAIVRSQSNEIVLLGLWDQTGAFADVGPLNDRGMRMALEERGMKVLGKPIKYITRDGATQAGTSTRRAEEAIDGEGARFMIGPWSSGVALAVSEVAKRKKVLHYFSGGTEDISGARCHRYSFQWAASPYTAAKTVVDNFMKANPKAKRWHLLVADYAFGWSVEKYVKEVGKAHGLTFTSDRHPLGERE